MILGADSVRLQSFKIKEERCDRKKDHGHWFHAVDKTAVLC